MSNATRRLLEVAKREKSDKAPVLIVPVPTSWSVADLQVREAGRLQAKIKKLEIEAGEKIDKIKGDLQAAVKSLQKDFQLHVDSIEVFAGAHKEDFGTARSKKGQFGMVGWRKSTSIEIKKNTLERIKELFAGAKRKLCVIVKESVSKEALAKLTDEELASVGARRKEKDVFYVEPDLTEAAGY